MKSWHQRKVRKLGVRLAVQKALCDRLEKAEQGYRSSYYTDQLHDAICLRVQIESELEYHKAKLEVVTPK